MGLPNWRSLFGKKTLPDPRSEKELRQALEIAMQKLSAIEASTKELGRENEALREEKKKLLENIRNLKKALEDCQTKNKHYEANFKKVESLRQRLMQPPLRYGIFVRPHPGAKFNEIDILLGSELIKVPLAIQDVSSADLKCGWEVLVNGKNQVVEITKKHWTWGSAVTFRSRLSDELAEVEVGHGEIQQCYISPELKDVKLKEGDRLLNCGGLLVRVIPKNEEAEHFMDLENVSSVTWDQVGGISKAVKKIQRTLLPFKERDAYLKILKGKDMPKGMILHGPEGCGKTLSAKAIGADLGRSLGLPCFFMNIGGAELVNKYVGETARKIREVFARAKEKAAEGALVIVFIDEIDGLFRSRDTSEHEPWMATDISQFNQIMDGVNPLDNVLVIGATNRKDLIDKAILRPGRLGVDIEIPRPKTKKDVAEILRIYLTADLPFSAKYFESDTYEYVDHFGSGDRVQATLDKDREKIREHFISVMVSRLVYTGKKISVQLNDGTNFEVDNNFRVETKEGDRDVMLKNYLSGAIIKSIVDGAKMIALERYHEAKKAGAQNAALDIKKKDFFMAIDEEVKRMKNNFKESSNRAISGFSK
jgi:proteasome-associated ATPase